MLQHDFQTKCHNLALKKMPPEDYLLFNINSSQRSKILFAAQSDSMPFDIFDSITLLVFSHTA